MYQKISISQTEVNTLEICDYLTSWQQYKDTTILSIETRELARLSTMVNIMN